MSLYWIFLAAFWMGLGLWAIFKNNRDGGRFFLWFCIIMVHLTLIMSEVVGFRAEAKDRPVPVLTEQELYGLMGRNSDD